MSHEKDIEVTPEDVKGLSSTVDGGSPPGPPPPEKRDKPQPIRRQARRMLKRFPSALSAIIKGGLWEREKKGRAKPKWRMTFKSHFEKAKTKNRKRAKIARLSRRRNR